MRGTVLVCDLILFIPAMYFLLDALISKRDSRSTSSTTQHPSLPVITCLLLALIQPSFILIDHGHFQYNNVALALCALSVWLITSDSQLLGSIAFVCALSFKQMSLYFALPVFFYLLRHCFHHASPLKRLATIGCVVILTFAVMFAPFTSSLELLQQGSEPCYVSTWFLMHRMPQCSINEMTWLVVAQVAKVGVATSSFL
jgi:alpha-1,3-glucosyltransferase